MMEGRKIREWKGRGKRGGNREECRMHE